MKKLLALLLVIGLLSQVQAATSAPPASPTFLTSSRNVYSSTNVTTGAWVQLVASLSGAVDFIEIADTCGQTLKLGFGPSGSEVNGPQIFPGGNGPLHIKIKKDTRVSIRAVSANCIVGESIINYYYY